MDRLSDISNIKNILSRHGFTFSKSLGQNFLINPSVCPKMAQAATQIGNVGVLEIGPGIGVLTNELCKYAKKVVSVELDKRLIPILNETLSEYDNVKIINDDIMKLDLKKLIDDEFSGMNVTVCANLPYYITSPIIMMLLEEKLPIESITVMVQKEAAERICAKEGSRDSGAVTMAVRYFSEPEMLFKVSSGSFMPAPKVDSAVLKLKIRKEPKVCPIDEKLFFSVIKASFLQRRKILLNSLSSGLSVSKDILSEIFSESGIDKSVRAEQLHLEDFCAISDRLFSILH